ncbi:MAG TPA: transglycosylase family protein [Acidimicrobiales bacterium]|nr:transglycosylase family protein [Acidimicrobiales bacterium]
MRTRIALVATIPVALITVSSLTPTATTRSARTAGTSSSTTRESTAIAVAMPAHQLAAYHRPTADRSGPGSTGRLFNLDPALDATLGAPAAATPPAPTPAPHPAASAGPVGPVDTVTPVQRAAWERVAMCEEGGNWAYAGSRFSGGLGISRENWIAYGGPEFAPVGAMATEDQQIMVAQRIQFSAPDQHGCRGW